MILKRENRSTAWETSVCACACVRDFRVCVRVQSHYPGGPCN